MAGNQYAETYVDNDMEGRAEERKRENVHAYESIDAYEPVGAQRAMPPPRPTNSSQQIESKRDEKTTNGLKYLTIAFVVTTVLFAGMFVAIFVLVMTPSGEQGIAEELACLSELGGIAYNGSCLWAEEAPARMTLEVALQTCNRRTPSKLPEVYGEKEYLKIIGYLRSKLNGKPYMHAWTSMRRNITTGEALLSDGSVAPYMKPRTDTPLWKTADATRTHVSLLARPDPSHTDQGMGARPATYDFAPNLKVVLCQKI